MTLLSGFRTQGFVDQISALDKAESEKRMEAIPELFELYREPLGDDAVDSAVEETLRGLLAQNEEETVKGITSADPRTRSLCVTTAGLHRFASAGPALATLARDPANDDILVEVVSALHQLGCSEYLDVFRAHLGHSEPLVLAVCAEAIGVLRDEPSTELLCSLVEKSDQDGHYEHYELVTEKAIRALARLGNARSASLLLSKIHHQNPTARKDIADALIEMGSLVVPLFEEVFRTGTVDDRILGANILGEIKDRKGADILVSAFDRGQADHPNIRFAIYEALGEIDSLKSLVCLMDGLTEESESLLMAVVSSLDRKVNPGVLARLRAALVAGSSQSDRLILAITASRATTLFGELFRDPVIAPKLLVQVEASNDPEAIAAFVERLRSIEAPGAAEAAERLSRASVRNAGRRLLAVDDSRSMLLFYQSVGSELGLEVVTAGNGREALDLLGRSEPFDLIITDLNMPVMDGIQFTHGLRSNMLLESVPVLMATTESESSQVSLAKKAGVTGFLQKPLNPRELRERIQSLLT